MAIEPNTFFRVLKGMKQGHILQVGVRWGNGHKRMKKYWAIDMTEGTKGLVLARDLELNCEEVKEVEVKEVKHGRQEG